MAKKNNIYERLLQQGYSKREIHAALHKCVLEMVRDKGGQVGQSDQIASSQGGSPDRTAPRNDGAVEEMASQQANTRNLNAARNNGAVKGVASSHPSSHSWAAPRNDGAVKGVASSHPSSHRWAAPRNDGAVYNDDITPKKNHPHPLVYFLRKVNIRKHVIGKALSLLESQFAKKPKNPV